MDFELTMTKSRPLTLDPTAKFADTSKPAFLAKPPGSPVYHGFVVVPETFIDGWVLGEITPFLGEENGDGFVVAPDGSQAGLIWEVGEGGITEIMPATPERWGVYAVWFPQAMKTAEELIANFRVLLPLLQLAYRDVHKASRQDGADLRGQ